MSGVLIQFSFYSKNSWGLVLTNSIIMDIVMNSEIRIIQAEHASCMVHEHFAAVKLTEHMEIQEHSSCGEDYTQKLPSPEPAHLEIVRETNNEPFRNCERQSWRIQTQR